MDPGTAEYDAALEWPGDDSDSEAQNSSFNITSQCRTACLRLVVQSSTVLPRRRKVAVLDTYEEVQIGRDVSSSEITPRIRLKDMEVSKLHATLFWDHERERWAVVDMGSKHGTFVKPSAASTVEGAPAQSSGSSSISAAPFARLSPSRKASMPRPLYHSDELSIGRTVFIVHVHPEGNPCDDCVSEGELDIPLFSSSSGERTQKASKTTVETSKAPDPKTSISLLKKSLLAQHFSGGDNISSGPSQKYIDRSAKRRALHPYSRSGSPPGVYSRPIPGTLPSAAHVSSAATPTLRSAISSRIPPNRDTPFTASVSAEHAAPISDSNIGRRLLAKQGWAPGNALGLAAQPVDTSDEESRQARMALVEPLQIAANVGKLGLGMRVDVAASGRDIAATRNLGESWKEDSKRRRWDEVRKGVM
ncbi:hypothetical protein DFH11DRAFT_1627145 [Phellopilus nigrolimitatus]|nr:hypothetical protein DFH11DRAFT_1627145 [Phellopilus nigrolimitatus]